MKKSKITKKEQYKQIELNEEAFQKFLQNFVKRQLRLASAFKWPYAHFAVEKNKLDGFIKCDSCLEHFEPKKIQKDHIIPVENIETGFTTWDNYINRLFIKTNGYQILCLACHASKTLVENELRKKYGQKVVRVKNKLTNNKKKVKIKK